MSIMTLIVILMSINSLIGIVYYFYTEIHLPYQNIKKSIYAVKYFPWIWQNLRRPYLGYFVYLLFCAIPYLAIKFMIEVYLFFKDLQNPPSSLRKF